MSLVKNIRDFGGIHKDSSIIVCGCGTSLLGFKEYSHNYITIGVNDVPRLFDPNYLVVTDHPGRFHGNRKNVVNNSKAKYLFTCVAGWRHPHIVHFDLGLKEPKHLDTPDKVDHYLNSPYVAIGIAYKLGAKNIGLIGVDFTDGHFYKTHDGPHPIIRSNYLGRVDSSYNAMHEALNNRGVSLWNLSEVSRLTLPKMSLAEFSKL